MGRMGAQVGDIKETNVSINEGSGPRANQRDGLKECQGLGAKRIKLLLLPSFFDSQERLRIFPDAWTRATGER